MLTDAPTLSKPTPTLLPRYGELPKPVLPKTENRKLLKGQKAIVTGASSGIGRSIALALGHAGADVCINYVAGEDKVVNYEPAESETNLFGGNSNWRGPIWFPINYLLIESLQKFHHYYGDDFRIECPTGSGNFISLDEVANELSNRLIATWLPAEDGRRPFARASGNAVHDERDRTRYWFHEYFHGDTGAGLGASHQTGWTGLVAKLIQQQGTRGTIVKRDAFTDL